MAQRGHWRRPPGPLQVRSAELAEHLQRHGYPAEVTGPPRPAPPSDLEYRPWTWTREWHADREAP